MVTLQTASSLTLDQLKQNPTINASVNSIEIKASNHTPILKHDFGKTKITLDGLDVIGDWSGGFDDDGVLVVDTTTFKEGTASIRENIRLSGDPGTTLNDCDEIADIIQISTCDFSLNETTYKEGSAAINVIKSGESTNCGFQFEFDAQNFQDSTHKMCFWLYIKDQITLDKIERIWMYAGDGSDWNVWKTNEGDDIALPSIGWNFYRITVTQPDAIEGGGVDESIVDRWRIRIYTNETTDVWSEEDVIVDFLHRRVQSGYGSILNRDYDGDWSGHSDNDKISFWFYCPDLTKFYGIDFSFGDTVSGGIQSKALYGWVSAELVDGWNYLSALIADFTFDGSYTMDFSDIKELRFTTRYTNNTTTATPYTPEEELEVNVDSLKLEKSNYMIIREVN